jgi:hypothetical protein
VLPVLQDKGGGKQAESQYSAIGNIVDGLCGHFSSSDQLRSLIYLPILLLVMHHDANNSKACAIDFDSVIKRAFTGGTLKAFVHNFYPFLLEIKNPNCQSVSLKRAPFGPFGA